MTIKKSDTQLKQDIEAELLWDPRVNAAQIGVSVDKGVVSLLGAVDNYAEKWAAERATKRVAGVRTVAQDLTVKLRGEHQRTDAEIAATVDSVLKWDVFIPSSVRASVRHGTVTLEGEAVWQFQRDAARSAVRNIVGVVGVHTAISLKPAAAVSEVKEKVEAALHRLAAADARSIHVEASGGKVTLSGTASSWRSMEDASHAAWAAPGVTSVVDNLKVGIH